MRCKSPGEYSRYLFGPRDCSRKKPLKYHPNPPRSMYATGPRRPCFTRLFGNIGRHFWLNWAKVTPARRGKRKKCHSADEADQTPAEKRTSMTWAKRLKRVFNIDIETCSECGGDVCIIASIEDPAVIQKILTHLDKSAASAPTALLPDCRASPSLPMGLFD